MPHPAFESMVVEALEDVSPCHFTDPSICRDCPQRGDCAAEAEMELRLKYPYARWWQPIWDALGGRQGPN